MSRILIAWELGRGWGHLYPMRILADRLVDQGHEVIVAARDLPRLRQVFFDSDCRIMAAPFFPGVVIPQRQMSSLSDVLWYESAGHSEEVFVSLFLAWREMICALKVDLVIADAAQMALAAASGMAATLNYLHYFHSSDPKAWSVFRDWEQFDKVACTQRADTLLDRLNRSRRTAGLSPVEALHEGFAADRTLFRILPELDYVGLREGVGYVGQLTCPGRAAEWSMAQATRRIFVYLWPEYEYIDRALGALQHLEDTAVLCFHGGIPEGQLKRAPHIQYSTEPFDLSTVIPEVDAVVCHGGGVQVSALQLGKPSVLLPLHTENFLSARAAEDAGIAAMVSPLTQKSPNVLALIKRVMDEPGFTERAAKAANSHRLREPDPESSLMEEVSALLP